MKYNWINANDFTMEDFLFFDRWIIKDLMQECTDYNETFGSYKKDMGIVLSQYPHVARYCREKAPECAKFIDESLAEVSKSVKEEEARKVELNIIRYHETYMVYAFPEIMDKVNYIRNWDEQVLYDLVELKDKVVLDVGAGTGRLTFAAAKRAKRVYASEPCDRLREYMRDNIKKLKIKNIKVLDGFVMDLPYEDNTFDVVLSGHVVGDYYEEEIAELSRITKNGGWIVCCNGDDEFKRKGPDEELTKRGFEYFRHDSIEGGIIYNYRKQVKKGNDSEGV